MQPLRTSCWMRRGVIIRRLAATFAVIVETGASARAHHRLRSAEPAEPFGTRIGRLVRKPASAQRTDAAQIPSAQSAPSFPFLLCTGGADGKRRPEERGNEEGSPHARRVQ